MAKGDQIYINFGNYTHHGIDCGDGTAIHYIGESMQGVISRTSMDAFTSGKQLFTRQYEICDLPEIIIQRAESRLGEDRYNLLFNNCEHFSSWCKTGKHESEQVNSAVAIAVDILKFGASFMNNQTMNTVNATFVIPEEIAFGVNDGTLERVGGIIRDTQTKQVVAWLRESSSHVSQVPALLNIGSTASVLNLGVSVMGFALVMQRLQELEQRLQKAQEVLNKVNRKIDLGYYANFRAALDLAINAFTMNKPENRRNSALQAINRFLEAQHIYTKYIDLELEQKSQIVDEYIMTLSLAYIAEIRCYLELEEHDTALRRFQEGSLVLRSLIQKYVELLLTSNPAAYLQPEFRGKIDLQRLTKIYQWIDPVLNENAVFEMQRENLIKLAQEPNKWIDSLPSAILDRVEVPWGIFGPNPEDLKKEATKRLPQTMEVIESMIETYNRLESYQSEVKAIAQLGISFQDWLKLAPAEAKPEKAELMYIIPSAPL
ncbi:MAG: hypothetical protein CLLPBCKN_008066 [Chroococcidiopsis cubana SAG 39.79]|uniref:lecithin retinol acyltransferase family protein n=1 Tax=Chroococcidiopsis cubana TaxID=171392 RepID=UPI002AC66F2D|nr:lecithin retinol acyltransferase family protein [Chroococcidiopsis cubana]MDZ4878629.1 hypothetical protein [Chroococcidiopsis cubana SAG 39.79]